MRSLLVSLLALSLMTGTLAACGGAKNADLELQAARKALEDAKKNRASDCAKEIYAAAEATLNEAQALAAKKEFDKARAKAQEAETLASQARGASPPGCNEPKPTEDPNANTNANANTNDANSTLKINDVEQVVYFDFNEANIREDSKALLTQVSDLLRKDAKVNIEIEGHCDTRGSTEYNLQLGERRAIAVQKYLLTQGVKPNQMSTISYGEERPVDLGESESAHQKNRRAEIKKR